GLALLQKEIVRLSGITDSYLDLARSPRLKRDEVQLNGVVEELHDLYSPVLREKGIYCTCDLGDLPPVDADRGQIAQAVGNLLKNASEAFPEGREGGKYIRVITAYNEARREVTLTVMDNGIGMPEELQRNI